jgi:hypothetical protein
MEPLTTPNELTVSMIIAMKRSTCSSCGDICLFGSCILPCLRTACDKCYSYGKSLQGVKCTFCNVTHPYETLYRESDMRRILRTSADISLLQTNRTSCTLCVSQGAVSFCTTCQTYECVKCNRIHGVLHNRHSVQTVAERKDDIPSALAEMKDRVVTETKFCPVHLHRRMRRYCPTCKVSFCISCAEHHLGHRESVSLYVHAQSLREETLEFLREKKQRMKVVFDSIAALHDSYKERIEVRYRHNIRILEEFMYNTRVQGGKISCVSMESFTELRSFAGRERDYMLDLLRDYKTTQYMLSNEFSIIFDIGTCPFTPFSSSFAFSLRTCITLLEKRIASPKISMHYYSVVEGKNKNGMRYRCIDEKTETLV